MSRSTSPSTTIASPETSEYTSLTIKELKVLLKGKGLKVGGKKPDLIARLQAHEGVNADDDEADNASIALSIIASAADQDDEEETQKRADAAGKKPKGAKSAYIFFSVKRGVELRALPEHKGKGVGEFSKLIGAEWKTMDKQQRAPYVAQSAADKLSAAARLKAWHDAGGVEAPKKSTKRKAAKGPKKPKGARSAYNMFSKETTAEMRALPEHEGKSLGEISKLVGSVWKSLDKEARKPYVALAEQDKKRHAAEIKAWKAAGGSEPPKKSRAAAAAPVKTAKSSKSAAPPASEDGAADWPRGADAEEARYLETTEVKFFRLERLGSLTRLSTGRRSGNKLKPSNVRVKRHESGVAATKYLTAHAAKKLKTGFNEEIFDPTKLEA